MVNWVIMGVVAGLVFLFFKLTAFKYEKIWTYTIAFLLLFLLVTFLYVISYNEVDISNFEGLVSGTQLYFKWIVNFGQSAAQVTGNSFNFEGNLTR